MSVSSSTSTISYTGNGSTTTAYTVPFNFYDAADLKVYLVDASGNSTLLTITTNYTVSGGGGSTGSVTTTAAIPSTRTVLIQRMVPYTQLTSFTTGDRLPANSIETALDKLTMETQQLSRNTLPDTAITSGSAPYVLGITSAGTSPYWVSQTASAIADGSITASKLSTGHPSWDASGNLTATSFVGNINGAVTATTGSFSGSLTVSGGITGNLTGTASAITDGAVSTTAKLADGIVTKAKLSTNEQKQLCKAWVNFNGANNPVTTSSVSFSGTTIQCGTASAHGLIVGEFINITGQTGNNSVLNGTWAITAVNSTTNFTFVVLSTPAGSLSNFSAFAATIRSSYNVSSITKNGTGNYTVNFTTAMSDTNYTTTITSSVVGGGFPTNYISTAIAQTASAVSIIIAYNSTAAGDASVANVQVFGN
jgi:hypothetical protein